MTTEPNHSNRPFDEQPKQSVTVREFGAALPGFTSWWLHSRSYRLLFGGIPALVLGLFVMLGILSRPFYSTYAKAEHYKSAARAASDAEKYRDAELCFRKVYELDAMDNQTAFGFALLLDAAGRATEALAKTRTLAPDDSVGHGPAHLWMAKAILQGKREVAAEHVDRLVEWHLRRAMEDDSDNLESRRVLALHYFRLRRFEESAELFQTVAQVDPESCLTLAQAYIQANRQTDAEREARKLVRLYEEWDEDERAMTAMRYLRWTEAHAMLGDLDAAERVLLSGKAKYPDEYLFQTALASVYLRRANALRDETPESLAEQLVFLDTALRADPRHSGVLTRVAELTQLDGNQAENAQQLLKSILAEGKASALVHTILGAIATEREDYKSAKFHFDQAYRMHPTGSVSMNNLAWVLAMSSEPDLDRALQLAEKALRLEPSRPDFRETRGQILLKLERWSDAISDLEFALQHMDNVKSIHRGLAAAYSKIGERELAELHTAKATNDG